ncbi:MULTISPECIES: hypothetical protein [unclassified Coleofasciculus]|uniref:hypothetical protein n=1 Tax=unclassified Coleofasciculus TaxID=2692782 RepID=UPI00187EF3AF|nr:MULTISPECIES: hypothetical protein [unclassified Coleofasciculus]MBE9126967.1 hypothetical protein [Coleofasciculus sp. LEGE 07081]MBE9150274.1 hypothetical protein [Coleofasciculus sp. LEGE 07092]
MSRTSSKKAAARNLGYQLMRQIRTLPPSQGGQVRAIALTAYPSSVTFRVF